MAIKIVPEDSAPLQNYLGVAFTNGCDGVAVGEAGAVATTDDGGVSWTAHGSGFAGKLRDVAFVGPDKMVAVGGDPLTIISSTDKGLTWNLPADPVPFHDDPGSNLLGGVGFADERLGFAVGEASREVSGEFIPTALVLRTMNGGDSWTQQFPFPEAADDYVDVAVINSQSAVAVGGGTTGIVGAIIRTDDGGDTWNLQTSRSRARLNGVSFADHQHGFAVGNAGTILHTIDGGGTWTPQESFITDDDLLRVFAIDPYTAWVVGADGVLLNTSDAGQTWSRVKIQTDTNLTDLAFPTRCHGTAVGVNTILTVLGHP
jgi:photosystem II stability/assembly factor-like uncharacterized protein